MDVKSIIREMLNSGMSEQQIKDNLRELGIEDADAVFADAVDRMKPVSPSSPAPQPTTPSVEESGEEKELFASEPARSSSSESESSKPGFSFTRVSESGEKEENVVAGRQSEDLAASATELMKTVSKTSLGDLDSVEQKLDQTIALLKALQDINQKILQSQRDVLLRLK
ncbi:hypothetical protein HYV43_04500 [Candidatus Micrarchaeota archaeon]|nr:hypothetical protein [Candidatus Micrarchaeota archaeon]